MCVFKKSDSCVVPIASDGNGRTLSPAFSDQARVVVLLTGSIMGCQCLLCLINRGPAYVRKRLTVPRHVITCCIITNREGEVKSQDSTHLQQFTGFGHIVSNIIRGLGEIMCLGKTKNENEVYVFLILHSRSSIFCPVLFFQQSLRLEKARNISPEVGPSRPGLPKTTRGHRRVIHSSMM